MSEEEKRGLADLKQRLQGRVDQLQAEVDLMREAISIIDEKLVGISFKRADELGSPQAVPSEASGEKKQVETGEETVPLTYKGAGLGKVHLAGSTMTIEPDPSLELTAATRPFDAFFVRKIMEGMREADTLSVANKTLRPDQILSYDLEVEGPFIRRIVIRNVGGRDRVREIMNAAGWTFSTMVQNIRKQGPSQPQ
jgi:hypothetical protein